MAGIELLALLVAIAAALLSVRPPPPLEWERLFKIGLSTVIRGEVQSAGGDAAAWWDRVQGVVPYHPAARAPEQLLRAPAPDEIMLPAREGEHALAVALATLETPVERWAQMFEGKDTRDELLQDPAQLGSAYDPTRVLAPDLGWEAVATWSVALQDALARRFSEVIVVAADPWCEPLAAAAPHVRVMSMVVTGEDAAADAEGIAATRANPADRWFLLTGADEVQAVLRAMHVAPGLRDGVLGLINFGGILDSPWVDAHFRHEQFDTELNRCTGYFSVLDVDPEAPLARSWTDQRFPSPTVPRSGWSPIEAVDLGPLPLARQDPELFARALWVLLAFRLDRS